MKEQINVAAPRLLGTLVIVGVICDYLTTDYYALHHSAPQVSDLT